MEFELQMYKDKKGASVYIPINEDITHIRIDKNNLRITDKVIKVNTCDDTELLGLGKPKDILSIIENNGYIAARASVTVEF